MNTNNHNNSNRNNIPKYFDINGKWFYVQREFQRYDLRVGSIFTAILDKTTVRFPATNSTLRFDLGLF